jgi:hypothetical protein
VPWRYWHVFRTASQRTRSCQMACSPLPCLPARCLDGFQLLTAAVATAGLAQIPDGSGYEARLREPTLRSG